VVSLTFLEAWRLRDKVDPEGGPLHPRLLGIAVNVTRNLSRAARRHRAAMDRLPAAGAVPDFADGLADRIDDAARLVAVRDALAKLRRGEREVVALCVWSGQGYSAAAEALGVPVGTVRSRLSRARRKLRKLVAAQAWLTGGADRPDMVGGSDGPNGSNTANGSGGTNRPDGAGGPAPACRIDETAETAPASAELRPGEGQLEGGRKNAARHAQGRTTR
jgi:RNA polymerase sigma factor (sigma-70 family)